MMEGDAAAGSVGANYMGRVNGTCGQAMSNVVCLHAVKRSLVMVMLSLLEHLDVLWRGGCEGRGGRTWQQAGIGPPPQPTQAGGPSTSLWPPPAIPAWLTCGHT